MIKFLRALFPTSSGTDAGVDRQQEREPATTVHATGVDDFVVASHLVGGSDFPILNWDAANVWIDAIPDSGEAGRAWGRLERAWVEHLQHALGKPYFICESETALLLSTLERRVADATLAFMVKTLGRVTRVLDGIAQAPASGKDILFVFEDEDTYYRYISLYYPDAGEFAASGGMYINAGCGHFVTVRTDLRAVEPTIVHEMTHSCLSHLPIPAWLNEGLAVNTEQRLCTSGAPMFTPAEMHAKHRAFWGDVEIQQFWSGQSFLRNDDGNLLSYDLARILVAQLSADWPPFRSFVLHANAADAGAGAALDYFDFDLGAAASALLEREPVEAWRPNPSAWNRVPERGAF